jgi:thiol-disulfide isomerase/thioredoxin
MKSLPLFFLLLVVGFGSALAQGIAFEPGDWKSVVAKAKAENKLIFLDTYTTWCGPCKWMDKNVYPDAKVGERFNAGFVNYKIDAEKGEGITLAKKYQVTAYPTYLFVAADESLVYRTIGSRPVEKFIEEADKAAEAGKGKPLSAYEAEYAAGKRDAAFLREYLLKKKTLGYADAKLTDEYLNALPADSLRAASTLTLLTDRQNPPLILVGSKAYDVLAQATMDQSLKMADRTAVLMALQQGIRASANQAAKEKNQTLFDRVLTANETLFAKTPAIAARQNAQLKMNFYKATKDLPQYTAATTEYVEKYLIPANLDSLRRRDAEMYRMQMYPYTSGKKDSTSAEEKARFDQIKRYFRSMQTDQLATQYNSAAWGFYETVSDKTQLEKALSWSQKSLDLNRSSAFLDTYAHLFYKLGRQKEAIQFQEEAIAVEKATGAEADTKSLEESLEKMKKKTL